jgi:hypothetical protein
MRFEPRCPICGESVADYKGPCPKKGYWHPASGWRSVPPPIGPMLQVKHIGHGKTLYSHAWIYGIDPDLGPDWNGCDWIPTHWRLADES